MLQGDLDMLVNRAESRVPLGSGKFRVVVLVPKCFGFVVHGTAGLDEMNKSQIGRASCRERV